MKRKPLRSTIALVLRTLALIIALSSIVNATQGKKEPSGMETQNIAITDTQLEQAFKGMLTVLEEGSFKTMLNSKFAKFKGVFNGKRIGYSLHNFILRGRTEQARGAAI